ncbi:MAG: hypothetical protein E6I01_14275 [Chloroflexi bacterium]|nr:MAG: hypothetical protein E6I01_14275 [Chloroflexota bacterium]
MQSEGRIDWNGQPGSEGRVGLEDGGRLEWAWEDTGNPHSVTAENGSFDSCLQKAGYTFVVSFATPGTYAYKCSIHPDMKGTVNVT